MSLDKLTSSKTGAPDSTPPDKPRRSMAWMLPVSLLLGFILIIALLFGNRLLPALEVETAPVITLRQGKENTDTAATAPSPPSAQAAPQATGDMLFQASGWIEPDPYITYVPTLINGFIDKVHVLEGQAVKKGQAIASLIDDDARLNLREATQKVSRMKAQIEAHCTGTDIAKAERLAAEQKVVSLKTRLSEAKDNLQRLKGIPAGAIPQQDLVRAQLKVDQQQAQVAEASAEIPRIQARLKQITLERQAMEGLLEELGTARDRAQLAMDRTQIVSPMDGIVLRLHAAPGKKRMLDMDSPTSAVIVELYDPKQLQARIDVPLSEAAGIKLNQAVELTSDILPDMTFNGRVTRISGEADLQRNTLQAKVIIENPDPRLRPEMLVRAKFFGSNKAGKSAPKTSSSRSKRLSLYVAEAALVDKSHVWVVSKTNTATLRTIKLGTESRDDHRQVLEGLKSGEHVILPPHGNLKEGSRVNPSVRSNL